MSLFQLIILILAGILAGFASGTLGLGGGTIVIPILVFILGFTQHEAQGTSLAFMLPPIGILAAIEYFKSGYVNLKFALVLVITFFIGAYLGSLFSISMPEKILKKIFGIFMILVGIRMLFGK